MLRRFHDDENGTRTCGVSTRQRDTNQHGSFLDEPRNPWSGYRYVYFDRTRLYHLLVTRSWLGVMERDRNSPHFTDGK